MVVCTDSQTYQKVDFVANSRLFGDADLATLTPRSHLFGYFWLRATAARGSISRAVVACESSQCLQNIGSEVH